MGPLQELASDSTSRTTKLGNNSAVNLPALSPNESHKRQSLIIAGLPTAYRTQDSGVDQGCKDNPTTVGPTSSSSWHTALLYFSIASTHKGVSRVNIFSSTEHTRNGRHSNTVYFSTWGAQWARGVIHAKARTPHPQKPKLALQFLEIPVTIPHDD